MKFLHISDLHIGLKLMNKDFCEDQAYILQQIVDIAKEQAPQALVIAGDIYDKAVPSAEAIRLFDDFVANLHEAVPNMEIMMISGNHDSASRVDLFRSVLQKQHIHMIGMPPIQPEQYIEKLTLQDAYGDVNFYLLPFVKPSMVKAIVGVDSNGNNLSYDATLRKLLKREEIDQTQRNVFVSHQFYLPVGSDPEKVERMDSEICTVGNIDQVKADVLEIFDYAALGHIHKPMKVGSEYFRYSGTLLACSISEASQQKGVLMIEMGEKGHVNVTTIPLRLLREVKMIRGTLQEVLQQACGDYVTVILTDKIDLDVIDVQDRIRMAFPNLLEIRRETLRQADYKKKISQETVLDPFALCCAFLKEMDEEEKELLQDVVNTVLTDSREKNCL